ncbi:PLD nuclease N-terminal domain-containing protein [Streptomyces sp. DSM 44915]|uniref:PLD nuclease N-terminal domain-containing protein n=1 Tax=Streptomyces chisholmiae TaxID=3075540 RepID=A0ABU2JZD9_9ACTN|nr:PLD nuclease N-terminal domain-containing protein [Streptomyces sp. DSM 44915]MDT0270371.1 PLD nuclease N-terminal domain-containing protein [Streptomyces sp. DSM 44915]
MLRVLLFLVPLALAIYALVDCISSKDEEVRHLPKLVWLALIALAWVIGPLAWILVGRKRGARGGAARRGSGGWVAPDDNPEFLRSLNDERDRGQSEQDKELLENWEEDLRRREDELRQRGDGDEGPGTPPEPPAGGGKQ